MSPCTLTPSIKAVPVSSVGLFGSDFEAPTYFAVISSPPRASSAALRCLRFVTTMSFSPSSCDFVVFNKNCLNSLWFHLPPFKVRMDPLEARIDAPRNRRLIKDVIRLLSTYRHLEIRNPGRPLRAFRKAQNVRLDRIESCLQVLRLVTCDVTGYLGHFGFYELIFSQNKSLIVRSCLFDRTYWVNDSLSFLFNRNCRF